MSEEGDISNVVPVEDACPHVVGGVEFVDPGITSEVWYRVKAYLDEQIARVGVSHAE